MASHDSETPAKGQQVFSVCGFIHHNFNGIEKVFVARRAKTKKFFPDIYELPGGHVDFGEDMVSGLKREVLEELKVAIEVYDPFYVFTYNNEVKGSHSIEVVYFAKFISPLSEIVLDPEDHSEFKWISEDEVDDLYLSTNKTLEDNEVQAVKRGFELIAGKPLRY